MAGLSLKGSEPVRLAALLGVGALAVHHFRYALVGVSSSDGEAVSAAHRYLPFAVAFVLALAAFAVALSVRDLMRAGRGRALVQPSRLSFPHLWTACSIVLVLTYLAQEALEGWFEGEPVSAGAILIAHGGWLVLLIAPAVGGAVALLCRAARAAIVRLARTPWRDLRRQAVRRRWPRRAVHRLQPLFLLGQIAGRAPPVFEFSA